MCGGSAAHHDVVHVEQWVLRVRGLRIGHVQPARGGAAIRLPPALACMENPARELKTGIGRADCHFVQDDSNNSKISMLIPKE
jgi:hypothetical protein